MDRVCILAGYQRKGFGSGFQRFTLCKEREGGLVEDDIGLQIFPLIGTVRRDIVQTFSLKATVIHDLISSYKVTGAISRELRDELKLSLIVGRELEAKYGLTGTIIRDATLRNIIALYGLDDEEDDDFLYLLLKRIIIQENT